MHDTCAENLEISKVALLFLTRGYLQHHDTWQLWLEAVQGMLPVYAIHKISCTAEAISTAGHSCGMSGGRGALQQQHLFAIYVHVGSNENFAGFPRDSVFHGRVIPTRLKTRWGTHSLTTAIRALLKEALNDAQNQRFVLLSEWDIPLYPPRVVYLQLMAEHASRIDACPGPMFKMKPGRWRGNFLNTTFEFQHWRRAETWFSLMRHHAQAIIEDHSIEQQFAENCQHSDTNISRWRECFSDQHYFATVLSFKGLENETFCHASVINSGGDASQPRMFPLETVNADMLRALRQIEAAVCRDKMATELAQEHLVHFSGFNATVCALPALEYRHPLAPNCPLFARKFGPETADAVTEVMKQSGFLTQVKLEQLD
ncbi:g8555 [Coccomyxa elongata]